MDIKQYINGSGSVEMKPEEFESIIAEAKEKAYHSGRNDANKTLAEMNSKFQESEKEKNLTPGKTRSVITGNERACLMPAI